MMFSSNVNYCITLTMWWGQFLLRRCFQRQHTQAIPGTSINAAGMRNKSGSETVDTSEVLCSAKKHVKVGCLPEYQNTVVFIHHHEKLKYHSLL
jgi:hypothetical protein